MGFAGSAHPTASRAPGQDLQRDRTAAHRNWTRARATSAAGPVRFTGGVLPEVRWIGDAGVLVHTGSAAAAHRLRAALAGVSLRGVRETVVGDGSLLVLLDPTGADVDGVRDLAARVAAEDAGPSAAARTVRIPVRYDGPDLTEVAALTGLAEEEVVRRHAGAVYTVAFTGFAPGFGYLTGLDPALHVPRRDAPRSRVPAGSVAIAGEYAGVYPRATPGGWRLLGRTDAVLFDPDRDPPALFAPGDRVRFEQAP
jgi:KipI family sensor histidine kinase inhibitor